MVHTKKLSGKQRVWIQIRPTSDTSRHIDKRDLFSEWGMLPRLPAFSFADHEIVVSWGEGGQSLTDTLYYMLLLKYLFRRGGSMVYFKEFYKFVCFHAGEGIFKKMLILMITYKTCDFPGGGGGRGPDHLSISGSAHASSLKLYFHSHNYVFFIFGGNL